MSTHTVAIRMAVAGLLILFVPLVHAQNYPNRPITIVIPLAASDAGDIAGRAIGEALSKILKTAIIVINRPGAGGVIATDSVVKAPRDGYTLLFAQNPALTYRPVMEAQTVPYDAIKDLTPLGITSRSPLVLAVRGDASHRSFKELVDLAKTKRGQLRLGTPGVASAADFAIHLINGLTGAEFTSVPFNGATPAVTALRGEHIDGVVSTLGSMSAHFKNGTLRALMISDKFPDLPTVPTLQELGYPQSMFGVWFAFLGPADMPAEVVRILVPAIEAAARSPELADRLSPLGIVQAYASPERLTATIREEYRDVKVLAVKAGLIK